MVGNKMGHHWLSIKQELKANRRLKIASAIALVLCVIWAHIRLDDWRNSKHLEAVAAWNYYSDTQSVAREKLWIERARSSSNALAEAEATLWAANSEGEAEAKLRDWLQLQAKDAGIVIERINVEIGVAPLGARWRPVHADFQGRYRPGAWQSMLQKIEQNNPAVVIDFEQLNLVNPNSLFYRLNVTAWFVLSSAEAK